MTFWCGSASGDLGPAICVIDLQDEKKKKKISAYYFLKEHLHFSKIKSQKESQNSSNH
jgi:hypothetical protein